MNHKFTDFMQSFRGQKIAIAVSGGPDSMALLHMAKTAGLDIVALHVNHGLRAAAAADATHVADVAAKMGVACHILHWAGEKPARGIEDAARAARYRMMGEFCRANDIQTIMVAHHADDQIETFLMNLARGSGVYGLAAMRPESMRDGMRIVRPLLDIRRAALQKYCDENHIAYVHDEMNDDERFTRVRMRRRRGCLGDELGIGDDRILLAIRNLGRTRAALDAYITARMAGVIENGRAIFSAFFLFDEAADIRLKLLGNLLQHIGGNVYQPRLNALERALTQLNSDCKFTLGGCVLRRLGDRILIAPEGSRTSFKTRKGHEKTKQNCKA